MFDRSGGRSRWAAFGAVVAVLLGGGQLLTASAAGSATSSSFVPITPCRLFDTRAGVDNIGPRATPLQPDETYITPVWGSNGNCTIPTGATGVSLGVTIVNPTASSYLTVFPADAVRPLSSNLNWLRGQAPTPNAVTAALSADGRLAFYNLAGGVDVLVDVVGYYELANPTVRISANPSNMVGLSEHDIVAVFRPISGINWCVTVKSDIGIAVLLPLEMPIGAHLLGIDIEFFDGSTAQQYTATLYEYSPDALSFFPASYRGSTMGGSASVSFGAVVEQHLTVSAETVVDEGDVFNIRFEGLPGALEAANGVCSVTIEYEPAP